METQITVARPDQIAGLWPLVFPFLKPAIDEDLFLSENMLKQGLEADKSLMFLAFVGEALKGVFIARIEDVRFMVVNVVALGGKDILEWKDAMVTALEQYAKAMKCSFIVSCGTRAWLRLLPDFTHGKHIFYKEVA